MQFEKMSTSNVTGPLEQPHKSEGKETESAPQFERVLATIEERKQELVKHGTWWNDLRSTQELEKALEAQDKEAAEQALDTIEALPDTSPADPETLARSKVLHLDSQIARTLQQLSDEDPAWQVIQERWEKLTFFESRVAQQIPEKIEHGLANPEDYETFTIQERRFTDEKKLWVVFPGFDVGHDPENMNLDGIDAHSIAPREGVVAAFKGPGAMAGATPEQCMEATDRVLEAVQELQGKYPDHEIGITAYSGGTHLAHYVANQLNKVAWDHERSYEEQADELPVRKLFLGGSGHSIGLGIYSHELTGPLQRHLLQQGIDKWTYAAALGAGPQGKHGRFNEDGYSQIDNCAYIPRGADFQYYFGEADNMIPWELEGGQKDYIDVLKARGIITNEKESLRCIEGKPGERASPYLPEILREKLHVQTDHVTAVASVLLARQLGIDIYRQGEEGPDLATERTPESVSTREVAEQLTKLPKEQIRSLVQYLFPPNDVAEAFENRSMNVCLAHTLTNAEYTVMEAMREIGWVGYSTSGRNFDYYRLKPEAEPAQYLERPIVSTAKKFIPRTREYLEGYRSPQQIIRELLTKTVVKRPPQNTTANKTRQVGGQLG